MLPNSVACEAVSRQTVATEKCKNNAAQDEGPGRGVNIVGDLPGEVREGLVGVGHAMHVLATRDGGPFAVNAATNSSASFSCMAGPFFSRTAIRIQRMANDCWRLRFTCIGTW